MPIPSVPNLTFPTSGSIEQLIPTSFAWEISNRADSYNLQVAEDVSFIKIIYYKTNIIETSIVVDGLDNNKQYYWRVSATNASGTTTYSLVWNFTTRPERMLYKHYHYRVIATPNSNLPEILEEERLVKLAIEHSQQWPFRVRYVWVMEKEVE